MSIVSPTDVTDAVWRVAFAKLALQRAHRVRALAEKRIKRAEQALIEAEQHLVEVSAGSC